MTEPKSYFDLGNFGFRTSYVMVLKEALVLNGLFDLLLYKRQTINLSFAFGMFELGAVLFFCLSEKDDDDA